ncbi:type IV secretory system conjugative DNA transfer family protein [Enemella sp. A6]|uniref:type IV secretory system conjugative DNA transfer family protein n=1 Tax=Enemella sp. A6 TaxID=3440152 RepID=UPI003EBF0716
MNDAISEVFSRYWPTLLLVLVVVVVAAVVIGIIQGRSQHRGDKLDRQRAHSKRWGHLTEVKPLRASEAVPADRLSIGVLGRERLWAPRFRSKLVLAPTGAGKTPRMVVPDILRHHGPAVVTSIKSDVLHLTRHHRATLGPVWVFDPAADSGMESCRWSPLDHVHDWPSAVDVAGWLTRSSRRDVGATANDEFWSTMARQLIAPAIYAAHLRGKPLRRVGEWIQAQDHHSVSKILDEHGEREPISEWQVTARADSKTRANVFTSAASIFHPWMHPLISATTDTTTETGGPVFRVADLVHGTTDGIGTLYAIGTSERQQTLSPIFEALMCAIASEISRTYQAAALPLQPSLLMMLDEAANICRVRDLGQWASAMAGQGMILCSVWQDQGQIIDAYGDHAARSILSNHTAHILLPGISDIGTLRDVSARIGQDQFTTTSRTYQRDNQGSSMSHQSTVLEVAPPEWIREAIPSGQALALVSGHKPLRVKIPGWWEDPELRDLVDPDIAAGFDALHAPTKTPR